MRGSLPRISGCAGVVVGHPFDTIKVHLQTQNPKKPIYHGTWHCFKTIIKNESVRGLYKGMSSPMGGVAFVNAIAFGVHANVQRHTYDPQSLSSHCLAGSIAGLVQSLVCSPMELVKTRLQLQTDMKTARHKGPISCLAHIYTQNGIRGVYQGLILTICRDVPGFGTYFVCYEFLMRQMAAPTVISCLIFGGMAGTFSWMFTFPIDVVKSCLQADGMDEKRKFQGIADCIQKGYKSEGIQFFCRGLTSTLLRAFPMNAACFVSVSIINRIFT